MITSDMIKIKDQADMMNKINTGLAINLLISNETGVISSTAAGRT